VGGVAQHFLFFFFLSLGSELGDGCVRPVDVWGMNELGFPAILEEARMEALLPSWAGLFPLESIQRLCNWAAFDGHIDLLRSYKEKVGNHKIWQTLAISWLQPDMLKKSLI
jgi:hypothetical protein